MSPLPWRHGAVIGSAFAIGLTGAVILAQELPLTSGRSTTGGQPEVVLPSPNIRIGSDDTVSLTEPPIVTTPTTPTVVTTPVETPVVDPCAKERAEEARTRTERDAANARFQSLDIARKAMQQKQAAAKTAEAAAVKAAKTAGGRWTATVKRGGVTETRSGWNKTKYGPAADRARTAADKSAAERRAAEDAYKRIGGDRAWKEAKAVYDAAHAAWQVAWDALQRCLGKSSGGGVSVPGGGITGGDGGGGGSGSAVDRIINGPVIGIPVRVIVCRDGDTRAKSSERLKTKLIDLRQTKIRFDSAYQDPADIGGFTDWLQWIKGGFFEGKKVKGLLDALKEQEVPVGGLLDTIGLGLPDFLSYYDKMGDEVIGALRKIDEITARVRKAGDYSLHYPTKPYTLTCTTQEVCRKGSWVTEKKFTMKRESGITWNFTKAEFAPDADAAKRVIEQQFRRLQNSNQPELKKMEEFEARCK